MENYEEKYKKVLSEMAKLHAELPAKNWITQRIETAFPELGRFNDDNMLDAIFAVLIRSNADDVKRILSDYYLDCDSVVEWLKKMRKLQGDANQNKSLSIDWSDEDYLHIDNAIQICSEAGYKLTANWLKALLPKNLNSTNNGKREN